MKFLKSVLTLILSFICLNSCSLNEIEIESRSESTEVVSENVISESESDPNNEEIDYNQTFNLNQKIKINSSNVSSGSIYMTITDAKAYKNFYSSGFSYEKLQYDYREERALTLPFIYLHIIVENIDAESIESKIFKDYNKYIFRIDSLLYVLDAGHITDDIYDKSYRYGAVSYFSEYDNLQIHSFAFELQPGDKKEYDVGIFPTAGFFDDLQPSWETYNLDELFASVSGFKPGSSLISLNLHEWEETN